MKKKQLALYVVMVSNIQLIILIISSDWLHWLYWWLYQVIDHIDWLYWLIILIDRLYWVDYIDIICGALFSFRKLSSKKPDEIQTDPLTLFHGAMANAQPVIGVQPIKKAGKTYQVWRVWQGERLPMWQSVCSKEGHASQTNSQPLFVGSQSTNAKQTEVFGNQVAYRSCKR